MKKQNSKKSFPVVMIVIFIAAIVSFLTENVPEFARFMSRELDADAVAIILAGIIFAVGIIAAIVAAVKKSRVTTPTVKNSRVTTPAAVRAKEHELKEHPNSNAAIRCTCAKGRQRYLDQADMFLKNGLIDKNEWRAMRERYMKMEIPEEM